MIMDMDKSKYFMWKVTGENQSGEQAEERKREKGSASVIKSTAGRISE
jgi:hypothetical protein